MLGRKVPAVTFRTRVRDEAVGGPNPFRWEDVSSDNYFAGKRVVLFSLPGAFTPTCSTYQLPDFEKLTADFRAEGIDEIYCISVNDAFVMNAWKRDTDQRDEAIFLADGNADFAKAIGMELDASGNGLGIRSKRYSMLVEDGVVKKLNLEPAPGKVEVSGGDTLLGQL